jgi:RNA-directed DNA polymerase
MGQFFVSFSPAVSNTAAKSMRQEIRWWRLHRRSNSTLQQLAQAINPVVRGWINYYGRFYRSKLASAVLQQINEYLIRWARWRYKPMRSSPKKAAEFLARIARSDPDLFAHWKLVSVGGG